MKKVLLILTSLTLFAAGELFAQSDDIAASATITAAGAVTAGNNLTFGNVSRSTDGTITINASTGAAEASNADSPQLGSFTITGSIGEQFAVSFTIPASLSDGGSETLTFSMAGANYGRIADSAANNGNFDPSAGVNIQIADDGSGGADPIAVTVGGEVQPTANQAVATYTANVTLAIAATSF